MRTETDQLQRLCIRFAVNQYQVGFDMAVPMVLPLARQPMVAMLVCQREIPGEALDDGREFGLQGLPVFSFGFALEVVLEACSLLNRSHPEPLAIDPA